MSRLPALSSFCLIACTTCSSLAQTASGAPSLGQAAVTFVVETSSINPLALVAATGKPLPGNGHWSMATTRPAACPQNEVPCARVLYTVPEEKVLCEWVVIPPAGAAKGLILDENDSASRYLIRKLSESEVAPLIRTRKQPTYPPIAAAAHVSGTVVVRIVVGQSGEVQSTLVLSGPPLLQSATQDAVKQWTFSPLTTGTHTSAFATEITGAFATKGPGASSIKFRP